MGVDSLLPECHGTSSGSWMERWIICGRNQMVLVRKSFPVDNSSGEVRVFIDVTVSARGKRDKCHKNTTCMKI